ncbi:MAG: hypothetical protein WCF85_21355 [Rhodospirillaceae bacterium]
MNLKQRTDDFEKAARKFFEVKKPNEFKRNFGVSNGARVIEGGLQLGVSNLEKFGKWAEQFVLGVVIRFPPEDEIYFTI